MTTLWLTGFEYGVLSANGGGIITAPHGGAAVTAGSKRSGNYGLDCTNSSDSIDKTLAASGVVVGRLYVNFGDPLPNADINFFRLDTGLHYLTFVLQNSDSKIYAGEDGDLDAAASSAVSAGEWYCIDFKADVDQNPWTFDWQIDEVAQTQWNKATTASTITETQLGTMGTVTGTIYFDDILYTNDAGDYPIGPGAVEGLSPGSDGTHNAGTNVIEDQAGNDIGVVTAYNLVDEVPFGTTTDYIKQVATGTGNYAEVNFADTSNTVIHAAAAYLAYNSSDTTANEGGCIVIDEDTTETEVYGTPASRQDYSETAVQYKSAALPTPGGGWDQAAVNALKARVGYSNNVASVPYWQTLMIEVAYGPAAAEDLNVSILSDGASYQGTGVRIVG